MIFVLGMAEGSADTFEDNGAHGRGEDLDRLAWRCPCGKTDLRHCIDPPQECLSRRYQNVLNFTELDVRDSAMAKRILRQQLLLETKKLKDVFADYAMTVYHYARSIREADLRELLRRRYPEREDTTDMSDFEAVYTALTRDADFLHIEPFERVLTVYCQDISAQEVDLRYQKALTAKESYQSAFKKFAQLRVFSVVGNLRKLRTPVQEGVYPRLKIKVEENFEAFTINRGLEFKEKVLEVLGIPKDSVHLRMADVTQGCVAITFEVIGGVDEEVFEMDIEKKQALASNKISMLEYDGKVHYCRCDLLSACDEEVSSSAIKTLNSGSLQEELTRDKDEHNHSPECPSIKKRNLKCPTEQCDYCEEYMNYCLLEFHTMECDKRAQSFPELPGHQTEVKHAESQLFQAKHSSKRVSFGPQEDQEHEAVVEYTIPTDQAMAESSEGQWLTHFHAAVNGIHTTSGRTLV